jgi:hypothetical protein
VVTRSSTTTTGRTGQRSPGAQGAGEVVRAPRGVQAGLVVDRTGVDERGQAAQAELPRGAARQPPGVVVTAGPHDDGHRRHRHEPHPRPGDGARRGRRPGEGPAQRPDEAEPAVLLVGEQHRPHGAVVGGRRDDRVERADAGRRGAGLCGSAQGGRAPPAQRAAGHRAARAVARQHQVEQVGEHVVDDPARRWSCHRPARRLWTAAAA